MNKLCQAELPVVRDCSVTHCYYESISYPLILLFQKVTFKCRKLVMSLKNKVMRRKIMVCLCFVLSMVKILFICANVPYNAPLRYKNIKKQFLVMIA